MITYLLEILIFQLAFLLVYDLFLKGETFFQWNRAYLLVTFIISLVLPWIKIEALKTTVSSELVAYPQAFFQLDAVTVGLGVEKASFWSQWLWYEWIFFAGIALTTILFVVKLYHIEVLRLKGQKKYYPRFTKVVVTKSSVAFSFFKHVFLGDGIPREKEPNILAHELVHIKQWHSLDLLFFELLRIVFWFNPLVYIYQSRMSELHEFIADAHVAKTNKKEQYQLLLAEVFQTQHISFVNQFFKSSLIKKRIVMLSKSKSKKVVQLKYLLLLPAIMAMLLYTSCEVGDSKEIEENKIEISEDEYDDFLKWKNSKSTSHDANLNQRVIRYNELVGIRNKLLKDINENGPVIEKLDKELEALKLGMRESLNSAVTNISGILFSEVDEVPIFPGCENATDKRACFQESMQNHIRKHFNYPKEAQELDIQGRVSIVFKITENGDVDDIRMRGPDKVLEAEALRIIQRLPKMKPGKQNGKAVSVPFSIPITFKLDNGQDINEKKAIAMALRTILVNSDVDILLPTQIGLNDNIEKSIGHYNKLVKERGRLLESTNESNPIIKNLDEQLIVLKIKMQEQLIGAIQN
ncbi:M56 family metallopeptidase [Croceitalea sp. P059]|uniref:M56 family metallopeptidase n=1 Tax=Croceitalea sp. P059 TaxID=3075601 RepID=UPI002885D990|nr:M56 family metallopeptidase [Croceitalea sp. P059]MDT0539104.1 M56 family metallopeptidase [Croceitalea sp. P059]